MKYVPAFTTNLSYIRVTHMNTWLENLRTNVLKIMRFNEKNICFRFGLSFFGWTNRMPCHFCWTTYSARLRTSPGIAFSNKNSEIATDLPRTWRFPPKKWLFFGRGSALKSAIFVVFCSEKKPLRFFCFTNKWCFAGVLCFIAWPTSHGSCAWMSLAFMKGTVYCSGQHFEAKWVKIRVEHHPSQQNHQENRIYDTSGKNMTWMLQKSTYIQNII